VVFKQGAVLERSSHLQSERGDSAIGAAPGHIQNPREPQIDHDFGLSFLGFDEEKFHRGFLRFSVDANFLRARQLFVTSESLQSIAKCPAANSGDCHRVAALESYFCAEL
jgi:hypothetical protein